MYVSTGPVLNAVPNVVGLDQAVAQQTLIDSKLVVGVITTQHSATAARGTVIATDPVTATALTEGSTVNLIVSDGLVEMPDVRNLPLAQAREQLESVELGLRVKVGRVGGCGAASDIVQTQSLAPGTVPQNSEVTLTYCDGTGSTTPEPTIPAG